MPKACTDAGRADPDGRHGRTSNARATGARANLPDPLAALLGFRELDELPIRTRITGTG